MCRPVVDAILGRCRATRILATSREPLATSGESMLEVGVLAVPAGDTNSPSELAGVASVQLFTMRVAASLPGFTLSAINGPTVAAICRATGELPLALELAAARVAIEGLPVASVPTRPSSGINLGDQAGLSASLMRTLSTLDESEVELFSRASLPSTGRSPATSVRLGSPPGMRRIIYLDRLVRTAMIQKDDDAGHLPVAGTRPPIRFGRLAEARRTAVGAVLTPI